MNILIETYIKASFGGGFVESSGWLEMLPQ